jgi:phosphoglycerate dehydrogenase-like enzyme
MSQPLIIVSTAEFSDESLLVLRDAAPGAQFHVFPKASINEVPADLLAQMDVLYAWSKVPSPEAAPNLKWVQGNWAGVDTVIHEPLFKDGRVLLSTGAGIHAVNMAEYTLMMMLAMGHRLPNAFAMAQSQTWAHNNARELFMPFELRNAHLLLIGYGHIGREIARLAHAFGMHVKVLRRSAPGEEREKVRRAESENATEFIQREQLREALREADFVVMVVPATPETRGMLGEDEIAQMKPASYVVNIGRGATIDEPALIDALQEGRIAGAALDVFEQEPLPADSPIWPLAKAGKVIMTPHIAGITPNYEQRAVELFAKNLRRFIAGQPLINQVDFRRGY